jgi:hypothetical protein
MADRNWNDRMEELRKDRENLPEWAKQWRSENPVQRSLRGENDDDSAENQSRKHD